MTDTFQEKLNKIINPTIVDTFDAPEKLGSHIATSSQGIAGSASNVSTHTTPGTLNDTTYTLAANTELVNCIQPEGTDKPIILSIKTRDPVASTKVNTLKSVPVNIEFGGIAFQADVEVKLNAAAKETDAKIIDLDKSKFFISKVTIDPNTKFNGTKFFKANSGKNIDFKEGTENLEEMTLAQLKTLFVNNKIQVSTQLNASNDGIVSVLEIIQDMNNNKTNQDPAATPTKTDDKTKWTDIAIVVTSIASIIGVVLMAKMSFSPSNSEYSDNIKFDDYKDDSSMQI